MVHPPRLILYLAVKNYLTDEQIEALRNDMGTKSIRGDKQFLDLIKKHFDIELFRTKPFIWQDIWLYNYIMYELKKNKFLRKGLIAKYDKEIIMPQEKLLDEAKELLSILNS